MANPKYTRHVSRVVSLVQESGSWSGVTSDPHPPVGNEEGSTRLARVEARFSEPDWPSSGRLISAHMTLHESDTSSHADYRGGNPRASVERINETHPDGEHPSSTGGTAKEFAVNGSETHDVTDMVEEMLPSRIKRRSNVELGCGNRPYGWFQIKSSDESTDTRSFVMTDDLWLTVEIKTAITPDAPLILEIVGAQEDTGTAYTVVGSTDGQTLEVRFAYRGRSGDTCSKAELELRSVAATDGADWGTATGTVIKTTGNIVPKKLGGIDQYSIKLTGIPRNTSGRFRIRTTSQRGEQGDGTSLEDDTAYVQLATIPGPPLDIVFQPFASSPHVLFSLNSPDTTDYLTGGEVEATYVPQGTLAWASGMVDIGGVTRRADLDTNIEFAPGQVISYRVRTRNKDMVVGQWSAPLTQTFQIAQAVTFSPGPGRLTSATPTITLTFPLADGARLRLLDLTDDTKMLYDSGAVPLTNQTSNAFIIPVGKVTYGQSFRAVGSYVPDGGGTSYTAESEPVTYTVAGLPTVALSVPDAVAGKVDTTAPLYLRTVTDPDGATAFVIDQEIRVAANPQGSGAFVTDFLGGPTGPVAIPGGTVAYETSVDTRARARNDIDLIATTTLNGATSVGATSATLTSGTGFVTGQEVVIAGTTSEVRTATVAGTAVSWTDPLQIAHASGVAVVARVFGPWSPWLTITALQPPDVDLLTPLDGATVNDPTAALDWVTTTYATRSAASWVLGIYNSAGDVLVSLPVTGTTSIAEVPAYLLDDATSYLWDVTVTDSMGMATTSVQRSFTTAFTEPLPVTVVLAEPDPDSGTMVLTWDDSLEPYLDHYEVTWLDDAGEPVRIDGGPESLLDGNTAFTGTTLTHIGARLGVNTYYVAVSNGWRSSDPVSTSATLTRPDALAWELVDATGNAWGLVVTGASMPHAGTIERYQAPGGQPRQITWGSEARRLPVTIETVPSEDRELVSVLRNWMATGTPVWVKGPEPYLLDPLWATLQGFTPTPESWGGMSIDLDWLELGDPVYAILPTPPEEVDEGEGNLFVTLDALDFGTQTET